VGDDRFKYYGCVIISMLKTNNRFHVRQVSADEPIETFRAMSRLYLNAWDSDGGLRVGYPPRDRLNPTWLKETWARDPNKEAFVAVDTEHEQKVVGAGLTVVHDGIIETCGLSVDPNVQRSGLGSKLTEVRFFGMGAEFNAGHAIRPPEQRFGGRFGERLFREVGANYITKGTQKTAMDAGKLVPVAFAPCQYNNLPDARDYKDNRHLAVSNGEIIFTEASSENVLTPDPRVEMILRELRVKVARVNRDSIEEARDLKFKADYYDHDGRADITVVSEGNGSRNDLLASLDSEPPAYSKFVSVPQSDFGAQKAISKRKDLIPCGAVYGKILYVKLPDNTEFPQLCEIFNENHRGGRTDGCISYDVKEAVGRVHLSERLPQVRNAYHVMKGMWKAGAI